MKQLKDHPKVRNALKTGYPDTDSGKPRLSQLLYLNKEIEDLQERLLELEDAAFSCTSNVTGMPKGRRTNDKIAGIAAEIADLETLLNIRLKECIQCLTSLNRYINSIEDSRTRLILSLKYINGLSWSQIARSIGGNNTAESIRKQHDRFLGKRKPYVGDE